VNLPVGSTTKLRLGIVVRQSDSYRGKRISDVLFQLFKKNDFGGATVLLAREGYDDRGFVTSTALGLSAKLPLVIKTVELRERVLSLLERMKEVVGPHGLITISEVDVI